MGRRNRYPGLRLRRDVWWIDIDRRDIGRIYEGTGCGKAERSAAERVYLLRLEQERQRRIFGVRVRRTFKEAATRHLQEETARGKRSLDVDVWAIESVVGDLGELFLDQVCNEALTDYIDRRRAEGCKARTVNLALQVVRRVLNKAARLWRDPENRLTWLEQAPIITMLPENDARPAYPITWDEERRLLLPELSGHTEQMAMFILHTGARDEEACGLRWEWEQRIPELDTEDLEVSAFVLPDTKNGLPRVLVLNRVAKGIVDARRGTHPEYVFTYKRLGAKSSHRVETLNNTAWQSARSRAAAKYEATLGRPCPDGFRSLHVHDLRHTFGRRLRALGVSNEVRQDLLGHANGNMTTHYSAGEIRELLGAVRLLEAHTSTSSPTLTVLRVQAA